MMVLVSIGKSVLSGKDVKFMQMDNLHPSTLLPFQILSLFSCLVFLQISEYRLSGVATLFANGTAT